MHGNTWSSDQIAHIKDRIESIPRAMREMGWTVSAELMERWLHSPAWVLPESWKGEGAPDPRFMSLTHLDQRIASIRWVMSHQRARGAIDELRSKMANAEAKKLLRKRLSSALWGTSAHMKFGDRQHTAVQLDSLCQANFARLGSELDTMDDLHGGLGKCTLKVALIGEARRDVRTGRLTLQATHVGFYIRDTYDFNGHQYLGAWTKNRVLNKFETMVNIALGGMTYRWERGAVDNVFNRDFEMYRYLTCMGGDFVIYSDVHWERTNILLDLG